MIVKFISALPPYKYYLNRAELDEIFFRLTSWKISLAGESCTGESVSNPRTGSAWANLGDGLNQALDELSVAGNVHLEWLIHEFLDLLVCEVFCHFGQSYAVLDANLHHFTPSPNKKNLQG